ncbi:unnamed protein product [Effrenium voratum]|nr:unnamed protein product [Effrenium voratum]
MPDISKGPAWSWQGPHLDVFRAGPAMDDEMNIYVTAVSGRTYKFSPEGKQLWEHFTGPARQGVSGVPSMGEDFLVMLTRNGYLISLDLETGAERWDRKVAPMTGLSCDSILIEGNLAIIAVADPVPPLVALGVHMQVSVENNVVLGIDLTAGEEKWRFFPAMECYNFQAATIGDGSFIFTDKTGAPYRVTLSGEKIWYTGVPADPELPEVPHSLWA